MKQKIEVVISPDGAISVEAVGYEGKDCEEATRFLEQALGQVQQRQHKPEYYRQQRSQHRLHNR